MRSTSLLLYDVRRITVFIVSCSILLMCCIIQCERDFCGKMKLNAPALGTAPPICAKTMAGHCNDKKKEKFQSFRIKWNEMQKKNIWGGMASYYKENGEDVCIYEKVTVP